MPLPTDMLFVFLIDVDTPTFGLSDSRSILSIIIDINSSTPFLPQSSFRYFEVF